MSAVTTSREEIVTNYYDGKKFFLVSVNGNEMYVSEEKFGAMNASHKLSVKNSR
ncbi:MAG: hypothetical protein H3C47_03630 [Candidatus Cloacimonetes bacterium]|nr:hypothetical protein [Candidatus Cloacimonadota bacterium]